MVARHHAEERAFAVHDLIVRERQHEVLVEGVHHAERQLVVMILPVGRVALEVAQRVVHPAHVPFLAEAQAAGMRGPRNLGPGGGLLSNRLHVRMLAVNGFIKPAQEGNRFLIFVPAVPIRNPLARFARVIQVEH